MGKPRTRNWITTSDAARVLGVVRERVCQLIRDGVLDSIELCPGRFAVDEVQVHRLAGARAAEKTDSAFARVVVTERRKGAKASAAIDRHLARGPLGMRGRELAARKP